MNEDTERDEDILRLPHPTSRKHKRMPLIGRAAQFAPFAALNGYEEAVDETARNLPMESRNIALITSPIVRRPLGALLKNRFPDLTVLSYQELPEDKSIEVLAKIGVPQSRPEPARVEAHQTL